MPINLKKGQRISLTKDNPGLRRLMCGLGWDVAKQSGGMFGSTKKFDLDSSILCLDVNKRLRQDKDIVYFGNLNHLSGAIAHQGDNLTGAGEGDDEVINIDLPDIPDYIQYLVFVINIFKAKQRKQHFGQVNNAFVRLVNLDTQQELVRYNLSGADYEGQTAMIMAEVYRKDNEWKMAAIGDGLVADGLLTLANEYKYGGDATGLSALIN